MYDKNAIKAMIEMSDDWTEADRVITEFTERKDTQAKLELLSEMFTDVSILAYHGSSPANKVEDDYRSILSAIVSLKWR